MTFVRAGNLLSDLLINLAGEQYQDLLRIAFSWRDVVGNLLEERTKLVKLEHNVLFVAVSNNVWMQELILDKHRIIAHLKRVTGIGLENIIFRIGSERRNV
ncbi:MAG: DUF721 domain-containing protein [Candidatus Cloacimonetes bacterium]|nr:DUF721 domain-containing protein [Candidatus Cloacimonadota bacterium]